MNILNKYPKRSEATASRIVEKEAVIVMPKEGLVRILNEVGSRIWELSDGKATVEGIIKIISSEFNVSLEEAKKNVLNFIEELKDKGMVVLNDEQIV